MSDELVRLTVVGSESEAAMLVGYLEAQGIEATYDTSGTFQSPGTGAGLGGAHLGRQEILVAEADLEAAQAALEALPG